MKLRDVAHIDLLEALNTQPEKLEWSTSGNRHTGRFILDGVSYEVQVDEYDAAELHLADVGFDREGSIEAVGSEQPSSRVLGAVVNALAPKLKELSPDAVLLTVKKGSGNETSRRRAYDAITSRLVRQRLFPHTFNTGWREGHHGWYAVASTSKLSDEQLDAFERAVLGDAP